MDLYEYAIVRCTPDIERQEFVNVGLIMMCKRRRWIRTMIELPVDRLRALCPDADLDDLQLAVCTFTRVVEKLPLSDPMAQLEVEERFRWLTAYKSTCISTSRPHPGLCENLDETFERLYARLVGQAKV